MKTFISILALVVLFGGLWWWGEKNNMDGVSDRPGESGEFCFAMFKDSPDSEFTDKYTLRLRLEGKDAQGELRLLPAEKDALVGKFAGTVAAPDQESKSRTAYLAWETEGEAMTAKQELSIIFDDQKAQIGFGEMKAAAGGMYVYADPDKVDYSFTLNTTPCAELNEREAVEKHLWENIAKLSPIAPTLGGNWYVVAAELDLEKNTGAVTYEDGHIQEKRNFSYALNADGTVASMTIE